MAVPVADIKVNGQSIVDSSGVVSLDNLDTTLGEEVVCGSGIGGIQPGTTFTAETTLADILKALLSTTETEYEGLLYYGVMKNNPTSVEGLKSIGVNKNELLTKGYTYYDRVLRYASVMINKKENKEEINNMKGND